MDSSAKQRLTGAVILVALFVLLVPELLKGPRDDKPAESDESGMRRYTIDLSTPQSSVQASAPAEQPEVNLPEVAQNAPPQPTRAVPGEAAVAAPAPREAAPANATASAPTPAPAPAPATAPAPAPAPTQIVSAPPARANPAPAPAAPRNDAPRAGSFAVQLGTFKERENADRLVREMTAKGFNAFVAPFTKEGRELYRVRVGPARDRAAAEALAAQLKRIGQSGSVVSIS